MLLSTLTPPSLAAQIVSSRPNPPVTKITVDTRHPGHAIPRTIFGTFLEPIGNSTYNGLWAELLRNPSLEPGLWSAPNVAHLLHEEPALAEASSLGLPLPWQPAQPGEGNRYVPLRGHAANSDQSVQLLGLPDKPVGLRQQVYLPTRTQQFVASLYARSPEGPNTLTVQITKHDQPTEILARATVNVRGSEWTRYDVNLQLAPNTVAKLEPSDFVVQFTGSGRIELDELSLMPADNLNGLDPAMVAMVRELHTPLIRFGGNFTSGYNWRDGVGPRDKRVSMRNVAWGIPELNTFGTDEFLHFCQLVGARPQIALNLGSGTPQDAADWVRYVDTTAGPGQLWELGNELWGNWNTGWPTLDQLAPRTLAFSQAVRGVDPTAQLIATGQDPDHFTKWNAAQLSNPPGTENFLSAHFVVPTAETKLPNADDSFRAQAAWALPVQLGRQFDAMTQQINATPHAGNTKLAFTEWLWVDGEHEQHTPLFTNFAGALVTAGNFNMLLQKSDEVSVSDMTGVIEFAGIWKKRGVVYGTPSSYVFRLYSTADADHLLPVITDGGTYTVHNGVTRLPEIPDVPQLDVVATASKDGRTLTLFVLNRSFEQPTDAELTVPGARAGQQAEVMEMTSADLWAANSETAPTALVPAHHTIAAGAHFHYRFPAASLTRVVLAAAR